MQPTDTRTTNPSMNPADWAPPRRAFEDGAWKGRRCFIIGGGPSLRGFDFKRLRGELTIGINAAWTVNPTCTLVLDVRMMDHLEDTPAWHDYGGTKVWLKSEPHRKHASFTNVQTVLASRLWTWSLSRGLIRLGNAGPAALNLADVLGASQVYLLGFDLKNAPAPDRKPGNELAGKLQHWHAEYDNRPALQTAAKVLEKYKTQIESVAEFCRGEVVNLNPDSALNCFPKADVDTVLR